MSQMPELPKGWTAYKHSGFIVYSMQDGLHAGASRKVLSLLVACHFYWLADLCMLRLNGANSSPAAKKRIWDKHVEFKELARAWMAWGKEDAK
jgi:hypothetical protein